VSLGLEHTVELVADAGFVRVFIAHKQNASPNNFESCREFEPSLYEQVIEQTCSFTINYSINTNM
jgi:hypothetical protein